jgi:hypothetical protein
MCVGFSQGHNAHQMNQIANFGSEQGNFMYVNTNVGDYQGAINEALGDSFDIALGSDSAVKFKIENQQEKYELISGAEICYTTVAAQNANENEEQAEDSEIETEVEVLITLQQIQKTALINDLL